MSYYQGVTQVHLMMDKINELTQDQQNILMALVTKEILIFTINWSQTSAPRMISDRGLSKSQRPLLESCRKTWKTSIYSNAMACMHAQDAIAEEKSMLKHIQSLLKNI